MEVNKNPEGRRGSGSGL